MRILIISLLALVGCETVTVPPVVEQTKQSVSRDKIFEIVQASSCKDYRWNNRGRAPIGYIKGMSLVFAKNHCKPLKNFNTEGTSTDALKWYGLERNNVNLFTLLIGLGLRESSGKYCCGRDMSNPKTWTAEGAEAGAFQTSYNAAYSVQVNGAPSTADEMRSLIDTYTISTDKCFLDVFKEGVDPKYCSGGNATIWGTGRGAEYQKLSKSCPTFHAEFTALTMLTTKAHHGPLITKAAEVNQDCKKMLVDIASYLDGTDCVL